MQISTTYNPDTPYGELMTGRPEDPDSHRRIAVYSKAEWEHFRAKGWKPATEFTEMARRALTDPKQKGYWS